MGPKTEQETIDGFTFHCTQMNPFDALALGVKLGPLISAALGLSSLGELLESDTSVLAGPIAEALGRISAGEVQDIVRASLVNTQVVIDARLVGCLDPKGMLLFTGNLPLMLKAAWFSVKVNLGNFIAAVPGALSSGTAEAQSEA